MTGISAKQIIDDEVRQFANYANERALPDLMDGLKPSQRKIVFCAMEEKRKLKVSQLGSYAAERYEYKHGEASIIASAVGLAQDFPGANNFNLLKPMGQFGNRLVKAASAPRYIYTDLADNFWDMFSKDDLLVMDFHYDEGKRLEPKQLYPVLPLILVNGADGTGVGFKSHVLQYNPKDVAIAVKAVIQGKKTPFLVPWVRGFNGTVVRDPITNQVTFTGIYKKLGAHSLEITDIPPGYSLDSYKDVLNDLMEKGTIRDYENKSTDTKWHFVVDVPRSFWELTDEQIKARLKLIQRETETLTLWTEDSKLIKFNNVEEIVERWTANRMDVIDKRKKFILNKFQEDIEWLSTKLNFILLWNQNADTLIKLKKDPLKKELQKLGGFSDEALDRLTRLAITSLTLDEVDDLKKAIADLQKKYDAYAKRTIEDLAIEELNNFK